MPILYLAEAKLGNQKKASSPGFPKANVLFCPVPVISELHLFLFLGILGCLFIVVIPLGT